MSSSSELMEYPVRWDLMILLLAVAGGGVDTVMILAFNVLTGAQTGNTVLLGAATALGRLAAALGSMISIICYVIGATLARGAHVRSFPVLSARLLTLLCGEFSRR